MLTLRKVWRRIKLCIDNVGCTVLSAYEHLRGRGIRYDHLDITLGNDVVSNTIKCLLKIKGINAPCLNTNSSIVIDLSKYYVGLVKISLLSNDKILCRDYIRLMITHEGCLYVGPLVIRKL